MNHFSPHQKRDMNVCMAFIVIKNRVIENSGVEGEIYTCCAPRSQGKLELPIIVHPLQVKKCFGFPFLIASVIYVKLSVWVLYHVSPNNILEEGEILYISPTDRASVSHYLKDGHISGRIDDNNTIDNQAGRE